MRPRQFQQIAGLPSERALAELAEGLAAIAEHCAALDAAAEVLARQDKFRAARILRSIAEEEGGKFLVLLDAARCGRRRQKVFVQQLQRADDHLAKGLYAQALDILPATFQDLLDYLESLRAELYLDGPNDVDWIFRNEVLSDRVATFYVDLVEAEGEPVWLSPARWEDLRISSTPSSVEIVGMLARAGVCTPAGLKVVTAVWHDFVPEQTTRFESLGDRILRTVGELGAAGLLHDDFSERDSGFLYERWSFPLHSVDLGMIPVGRDALVERRSAVRDAQERRELIERYGLSESDLAWPAPS